MTIEPMDCVGKSSDTDAQVCPPSYERHTPPSAAPTNIVSGRSGLSARAKIRPPILFGPTLTHAGSAAAPFASGAQRGISFMASKARARAPTGISPPGQVSRL